MREIHQRIAVASDDRAGTAGKTFLHVALVPFDDIDNQVIATLARDLHFIDETIDVAPAARMPDEFYNARRHQYRADRILDAVRHIRADKVLAVTDDDLYIESLNFVFGLAEHPGKAAVISTHRLRFGADHATFRSRVIKEAVHELGHTMGLPHCDNPRCVMHFSNTLQDTDRKGKVFCRQCQGKLDRDRIHRAS